MVDWAAFKRARSYLSTERWRTVTASACAVLSSVCYVLLVLILGLLAELLFTPEFGLAHFTTQIARRVGAVGWLAHPVLQNAPVCLAGLLGAAVLLGAIRAGLQYVQSWLSASAVADAMHRVRRAIYRQAYRLGTTEISGIGAAPAINVFTRETDAVRNGLLAWLDSHIRSPVKVVLLFVVALLAHWALALLFLVLAGLGAFLARRLVQRGRGRVAAATRVAAERLALLQESLQMIRLTRGYLMESYEQGRFEHNLEQFTVAEARQLHSVGAVGPVIEFAALVCIALVGGLACYDLLLHALSPFALTVLYASLISLYRPTVTLVRDYRTIEQGADAAMAVFAFLDQHSQLGQVAAASFLPPMSRTLEFVRVRLQEPNQPPVLDGVDLTIAAGSRVAIMGMDERALRALVYLIPRFLDPTEGEIRIDGQDVRLVTLESLRAQVALVLQGELVFNDTVAGNIGCGDPSFGLPHIVDAAKVAHAHQFIQRLPFGYDTAIGDQGEPLSVSQRFRIALARAILRDPTIVVIEEPEEHLDEDTKNLLDDTLDRFCRARTVIFLPHRLSTIRACDSIVLVHNGRVETRGNHRELTLTSELYRHLQYTEFNVFAAG